MSAAAERLAKELADATAGLLYPSESDEPFVAFTWPRVSGDSARQAVQRNVGGDGPIIEQSPLEFFGDLAESDDAERFRALRSLLVERLTGPCILRAGKIKVAVFLIGQLGDEWVGLRTLSIET